MVRLLCPCFHIIRSIFFPHILLTNSKLLHSQKHALLWHFIITYFPPTIFWYSSISLFPRWFSYRFFTSMWIHWILWKRSRSYSQVNKQKQNYKLPIFEFLPTHKSIFTTVKESIFDHLCRTTSNKLTSFSITKEKITSWFHRAQHCLHDHHIRPESQAPFTWKYEGERLWTKWAVCK